MKKIILSLNSLIFKVLEDLKHRRIHRPFKSLRSFEYSNEEMDRNIIRLEEALEFNQKVLPRLMGLNQG